MGYAEEKQHWFEMCEGTPIANDEWQVLSYSPDQGHFDIRPLWEYIRDNCRMFKESSGDSIVDYMPLFIGTSAQCDQVCDGLEKWARKWWEFNLNLTGPNDKEGRLNRLLFNEVRPKVIAKILDIPEKEVIDHQSKHSA